VWSLSTELAGTAVSVHTIHPGATRTSFFEKVGVPAGAFDTSSFADPADVARAISDDLARSEDLSSIYGSPAERVMMYVGWVLPLAWWNVKTWSAFPGFLVAGLVRTLRGVNPSAPLFPNASAEQPAVAVVTGGAGGLGRTFVEQLAASGNCKITSCDVQQGAPLPVDASTATLATSSLRNLTLDLAPPGLAGRILDAAMLPDNTAVDLLVLNAAVNHCRPTTQARHVDLPDAAIVQTAEVNLVAPLVLTTSALRHNAALKKPSPTTIFLCSLSTWFSYPGSAMYGASKDGLVSYSKSLRRFARSPDTVLCAFPGPMRTQMAFDSAPENTTDRINGRMATDTAATMILTAAANGDNQVVVAGPMIQGMVKKAAWSAVWAANLMRTWQYEPLLAGAKV
jgi:3-oxoacyl-[acyl-carrier protein] reductase